MSLSKFSEELKEALDRKKQNDEMVKILKAIVDQQAQTNKLLTNIKNSSNVASNKVTNMEMRQNMTPHSDMQGVTRHPESWALGSSANVCRQPPRNLMEKLLASKAELGILSYGAEMLNKDTRRMLAHDWQVVRGDSPQTNAKEVARNNRENPARKGQGGV